MRIRRSSLTPVLLLLATPGCEPSPADTPSLPSAPRGDTGGSSGSTATAAPDPGFNLDLPPVDPDRLGRCRAGHYSGSFLGKYTSGATLIGIPINVTGDVDLRLNQEAVDLEFFAIQNGRVRGTADNSFPYECDMNGMLNCDTKKLERGFIRCTYRVLSLSYTFSGPVAADFDPHGEAFTNGTWSGKEPNMLPHMGGSGVWNAVWDGP